MKRNNIKKLIGSALMAMALCGGNALAMEKSTGLGDLKNCIKDLLGCSYKELSLTKDNLRATLNSKFNKKFFKVEAEHIAIKGTSDDIKKFHELAVESFKALFECIDELLKKEHTVDELCNFIKEELKNYKEDSDNDHQHKVTNFHEPICLGTGLE